MGVTDGTFISKDIGYSKDNHAQNYIGLAQEIKDATTRSPICLAMEPCRLCYEIVFLTHTVLYTCSGAILPHAGENKGTLIFFKRTLVT